MSARAAAVKSTKSAAGPESMRVAEAYELFAAALRRARLAHAFLLVGNTRGAAAQLSERILQLLFCTAINKPCGQCDRCRQIVERTWCDIVWMAPEKKTRVIGVDQMRDQLLYVMGQTSLAGGWKAGVILGADRMQDPAANAFLKMLEEPPPRTIFLLLTDTPQFLLPTIVSRCQRLNVSDDAPRELEAPWHSQVLALLAADIPSEPLPAMVAAGRMSTIMEEMKVVARQRVIAESQQSESDGLDDDNKVLDARVSARYREMRADLLLTLMRWYRDLLVIVSGGKTDILLHPEHIEILRVRAQRLSVAQALANVAGIAELSRQLERNLPEESVLAYWMDRLANGVKPTTALIRQE